MIYTGHVKNGAIVLDDAANLPEGLEVRVEPAGAERPRTLADRLRDVIGISKGLPPDMARNHDHYLHGVAKR
ncbi:MAG TPA: hypothetical protein VNE39_20855 [Planctomycetota bacterium]|nr:hypothetical protein [Planctomycetota bacterium]